MKDQPVTQVVEALDVRPDAFACTLVEETARNASRCEQLIAGASVGWPFERMAVVDRLVLAMAVAELLDPEGAPTAVVIDEAVELAKTYSTEESGAFVNGILSTIAATVR